MITVVMSLAYVTAAAANTLSQDQARRSLDEAFNAAVSYDWGDSRESLSVIEDAVLASLRAGSGIEQIEGRLIELVGSAESTRAARDFACRQLRLVGGAVSVPVLASLLDDPKSGHMARFALDGIPHQSARLALVQHRVGRLLIQAAEGDERALTALSSAREEGVNAALASLAPQVDDDRRAIIAALLGRRGATGMTPVLDQLAREGNPSSVRIAALLALAEVHPWNAEVDRNRFLVRALDAAYTPDEQQRVLGAVARAADPGLIPALLDRLDDSQIGADVALIVIDLALILEADDRTMARQVVQQVVDALGDHEEVRRRAGEATAHIERHEGFITEWVLSGPYLKQDAADDQIFSHAFAPESDRATATWTTVPPDAARPPGIVDLIKVYGGNDRCAYAWTRIHSEVEQTVQLQIGSDDGVKAWLNDELVHSNNAMRALSLNQDVVTMMLRRGSNDLVLKITQGGGDWGFAARLRNRDGFAVQGVRSEIPKVD